ncbi:DUF6262 family protein [Streptomyces sp. NPDC048436]|uniref:DUF6262 family protein n=1 Tax=Streptomyces sp. NPDC048436 TaxID=3365550 RepID=UPI003721832F
MNGTTASRDARVAQLRRARQLDSAAKTARATAAARDLLTAGQRITFARIAREANVSTWFVYNSPTVKAAIQNAMNTQAEHGTTAAAVPHSERATPASLRTDLALAREEINDLKQERNTLKHRIQLALGTQIDNVPQAELLTRIQGLEQQNATLTADLAESNSRAAELSRNLAETQQTVESLRIALRKTIRAVPSSSS